MAADEASMKAMQKELEELKLRLAKVVAGVPTEPKVVFTPRERKINKFSGRPDGTQTVDEFVEDVELALKTRPTSDDEKVNFIISHLEGPAREEIRYRPASEKKKPKDVLAILKDVFGERGTISELLSEFYQCRQEEGQTLQDFSHQLMCKLDKVCKRDPKVIQDRDMTLRNQFAENVQEFWLRHELKKKIRSMPTIIFNDIREEARLLMEDSQEAKQQQNLTTEFDVPVLATQVKQPIDHSELTKLFAELKTELQSVKTEVQTLKSARRPEREKRECYHCGKVGHIKKDCRKLKREMEQDARPKDLNEKGLRQGAG